MRFDIFANNANFFDTTYLVINTVFVFALFCNLLSYKAVLLKFSE